MHLALEDLAAEEVDRKQLEREVQGQKRRDDQGEDPQDPGPGERYGGVLAPRGRGLVRQRDGRSQAARHVAAHSGPSVSRRESTPPWLPGDLPTVASLERKLQGCSATP